MASNNKSPPSLSNSKSYIDWLKLIDIWRKFTNLEPGKQGSAIVLSHEGDTAMISGTDGVDKIIEQLNRQHKKDKLAEKYNALESFETYKRNSSISIHDFLTEFENCYRKTKNRGTIWSADLLAYHLLKLAISLFEMSN